jgi:hypothetical protein
MPKGHPRTDNSCTKCHRVDPPCGFSPSARNRGGLSPVCRECRRQARSARWKDTEKKGSADYARSRSLYVVQAAIAGCSPEEYREVLQRADRICDGCHLTPSSAKQIRVRRDEHGTLKAMCKACRSKTIPADKLCSHCGTRKPLTKENFYRDLNQTDGYGAWCKTCTAEQARRSKRLSRYGLTHVEFLVLYSAQQGKCLICKTDKGKLNVDHCHKSKKVRGLLCSHCNKMLGHARDNKSILEAAIKYLDGIRE